MPPSPYHWSWILSQSHRWTCTIHCSPLSMSSNVRPMKYLNELRHLLAGISSLCFDSTHEWIIVSQVVEGIIVYCAPSLSWTTAGRILCAVNLLSESMVPGWWRSVSLFIAISFDIFRSSNLLLLQERWTFWNFQSKLRHSSLTVPSDKSPQSFPSLSHILYKQFSKLFFPEKLFPIYLNLPHISYTAPSYQTSYSKTHVHPPESMYWSASYCNL